MRLRALAAAFCLMSAAACDRSTARGTDSTGATGTSWTVDARGIGVVRAGMSVQELSAAVGEPVRPTYQANPTCDFVLPTALPKGVMVMVLADTVARVDVTAEGILTTEGGGVGDLESRVVALYAGRARVAPHKYTGPTGHYVIVEVPGDTLHRIIFETDGQRVLRYRAGRRPGVDFVEGCS